jgi:16S rRNA (guanine527-N7)-methyltransferase
VSGPDDGSEGSPAPLPLSPTAVSTSTAAPSASPVPSPASLASPATFASPAHSPGALVPPAPGVLHEVLADARRAGFLGPGPLETQLRHAEGFVEIVRRLETSPQPRLVDLGSGGGLPGLVVALRWPEASLVLLDASVRRTDFLRSAIERLGLQGRTEVLWGRAEELGRDPQWRGGFDGALARSFGRPAVAAECAAPFLKVGGWLVVSEPPAHEGGTGGADRWPAGGLEQLGLVPAGPARAEFAYEVLRQASPCPERFPRRNGVPAKKPLF